MISETITKQIAEALKAHDEIRLSTLRMLSSALNYEFIAKQHKLSQEEEIVVVQKEAKKRKDAIEAFRLAQGKQTSSGTNMDERIKKEEAELTILEEYLPQPLSDNEIKGLVEAAFDESGASSMADMGKVIGLVMGKAKGRADGKKVSELVRARLAG
jgi:hypothetical protein